MSIWPRTRDGLAWGAALAILFVASQVLIGLIVGPGVNDSAAVRPFAAALFSSELILLAIWTAFGKAPFSIRLACLALATMHPPRGLWMPTDFSLLLSFDSLNLGLTFLAAPLLCFALRVTGFEVVQSHGPSEMATPRETRLQRALRLAQLIVWLAAIVIVLYVDSNTANSDLLKSWSPLPAGIAIGVTVAALGRNHWKVWIGLYLAITICATMATKRWIDPDASIVECAAETVLTAAIPAAALLLFRRLGYRLTRNGLGGSQAPNDGAQPLPIKQPTCVEGGPDRSPSDDRTFLIRRIHEAWFAVRRAPPLILFLIAAIVLVDATGFVAKQGVGQGDGQLGFQILLLSQAVLIGFWAGMGSTPALVRFPLATLGIAIVAAVSPGYKDLAWPKWCEGFVTSVGPAATVAIALLILRAMGVRLVYGPRYNQKTAMAPRLFQFSIGQALLAMTEAGMLMALLKFVLQFKEAQDAATLDQLWQCAESVLWGLGAAWLAFGRRRPVIRVLSLIALQVGILIIWKFNDGGDFGLEILPPLFVLLSIVSAGLAGPLAVFRVCGYRFERRVKASKPRVARLSPDSGTAQLSLK